MLIHADSWDAIRPLTNNERRAEWARKYYQAGHHMHERKPRIRIPVGSPARRPAPQLPP